MLTVLVVVVSLGGGGVWLLNPSSYRACLNNGYMVDGMGKHTLVATVCTGAEPISTDQTLVVLSHITSMFPTGLEPLAKHFHAKVVFKLLSRLSILVSLALA